MLLDFLISFYLNFLIIIGERSSLKRNYLGWSYPHFKFSISVFFSKIPVASPSAYRPMSSRGDIASVGNHWTRSTNGFNTIDRARYTKWSNSFAFWLCFIRLLRDTWLNFGKNMKHVRQIIQLKFCADR